MALPSHLSQATSAFPVPRQTEQESLFLPEQRSQVTLPPLQSSYSPKKRRAPRELIGVNCPLLLLTLIFALPLKAKSFISPQNFEQGWLVEPVVLVPVLALTDSVWSPKDPPVQRFIW